MFKNYATFCNTLHDQTNVQINRDAKRREQGVDVQQCITKHMYKLREILKDEKCSNTKARQECWEVAIVSVILDPINSLYTVVVSSYFYLVNILQRGTSIWTREV